MSDGGRRKAAYHRPHLRRRRPCAGSVREHEEECHDGRTFKIEGVLDGFEIWMMDRRGTLMMIVEDKVCVDSKLTGF